MKARDVMVAPVITANPGLSVRELAQLFVERGISAVPVVDQNQRVIGLVSESDLMRRAETGTERQHQWWLKLFVARETLAAEYTKAHARKVADVMTKNVITATPETPLDEIATLLEKHAIKRVPIVENGQLVGIVSRANLVQAVASAGVGLDVPLEDETIRSRILKELKRQEWAHLSMMNVMVNGGVVDLWGAVPSEEVRRAVAVAAEGSMGVRAVNNHLFLYP
jgi:CBS-domain-containing membrane protein